MTRTWRRSLRRAILSSLVAMAGIAQAQAPADDGKRRLIEQKIRLLETLLGSPAAKNAAFGKEAETTQLIEKGSRAVDTARRALAEQRLDEASAALDDGMKAVSAATRRLQAGSALSESAQRKTYDEQSEQVATYRASALDLTRDPRSGEAARALVARLDALTAEARQLAAGSRLGEANRKLAEAYKLATEEIARLRQGQEVVMSLKFDSPADEYAYEQKRYGSNEIMVDMLINEGKAEGDRRRLVDGFVNEGRRLKREAEAHADAAQFKEALARMEKANDQMKRALQAMGVAVF
jgi:hypothetical protein